MQLRLLSSMAAAGQFIDGLVVSPQDLLDLTGSSGAAVAVDGFCKLIGETPSESEVNKIVAWLSPRAKDDLVVSNQLAAIMPGAESFKDTASGLLAIAISQIHDSFVIWETVRQQSMPWHEAEIDAASDLRTAIVDIVLRKAEGSAALSQRLTASNKELEAFSYSVSHDLRAPFRHIVGYAQLLKKMEAKSLSDKADRYIDTIIESALSAGTLVDDLLSFSQMGRATIKLMTMDVNDLVKDIRRRMAPDEQRPITWRIGNLPEPTADPTMLRLVFQNLIENAVMFTRGRDPAVIEIGHGSDGAYFIRDNGTGFDMAYFGKLFGVFQRLHRTEHFQRNGHRLGKRQTHY